MSSSRIEQLLQFKQVRPDDPFVVYALAIEYKNGGCIEEALTCFTEVYTRFPDYVPTYLHFGGLLSDRGETGRARDILAQGIEKARASGDGHALSELSEAFELLTE